MKWRQYGRYGIGDPYEKEFWQLKIAEDIYLNAIYSELPIGTRGENFEPHRTWELKIQLRPETTGLSEWMNITLFSYAKKDFKLFEKEGREAVERLMK